MNIEKFFWSLNQKALDEVKDILSQPGQPKYINRAFTLLSRCDEPKVVFSVIKEDQFVKTWPRLRKFWKKTNEAHDFRAWWETVYEELLQKKTIKDCPPQIFLKIGKIIRQERIKKQISQSDFAKQAHITQPNLSAIESGKKNVTLATLIRLCRRLGIKSLPMF